MRTEEEVKAKRDELEARVNAIEGEDREGLRRLQPRSLEKLSLLDELKDGRHALRWVLEETDCL